MAFPAARRPRRRLTLGRAALPLLAACGQAAAPTPSAPTPSAPTAPAKGGADVAKPAESKPAEPTGPAAAPAKSDAAPAKAADPARSCAPVTLVWDTFRRVGTPYPDELIKAFRAKQPNITIEIPPLPTSQTDSYPKLY